MKRLKIISLAILIFLIYTSAPGQFDNAGTSVANFLKIGVGARAISMGSANVAAVNDGSSLYWNIAGMTRVNSRELFFAKTDWLLDISHNFVAVIFPLDGANYLGLSINSITMGEMEETTEYYPNGTGITFSGSDMAVGIAYARRMSDHFSVGIQGKYLHETVAFSSASTIAIDVGSLYATNFLGMKIGMALSNFGGKMRLRGREQLVDVDIDPTLHSNPDDITARLDTKDWPIPLSFRIGVALDLIRTPFLRYTQSFDYWDVRDLEPIYSTGIELAIKEKFFLRAGLERRYFDWDIESEKPVFEFYPSFGAGLNLTLPGSSFGIILDVAYIEYIKAFDPIYRYSGALHF